MDTAGQKFCQRNNAERGGRVKTELPSIPIQFFVEQLSPC